MKIAGLSFIILFSLIAFGQEPSPPTREWCEWAFGQIPDRKELGDVDSTAFSSVFYRLLKEVDRLNEWEFETYGCKPEGADCLLYWYSGMESSPLDGGRATVSFDYTPESPLEGVVTVSIDHPDLLNNDGTRITRFPMSVIYENGAWRIRNWDVKWYEIADAFDIYERFVSDIIVIDNRAKAIINEFLEKVR